MQRRGTSNSVLAIHWRAGGATVESVGAEGQRRTYVARAGSFDLFAPHQLEYLVCGSSATPPLIALLRAEQVHAFLAQVGSRFRAMPSQARLQFDSRRLSLQFSTLDEHRRLGEPLGSAYTTALSTVIANNLMQRRARDGAIGSSRLGAVERHLIEILVRDETQGLTSLEALASLVGVSVSTFVRQFKVSFGVTPHQYVVRGRIEAAKTLLATAGESSLTDLALRLGFSSHAHFTSTFRAHAGLAPNAYRLEHTVIEGT